MSMTANLHDAVHARADQYNGTAWLEVSNADRNKVSIFMPFDVAEAMAKAFNEAKRLPAANVAA